MMIWRWVDVGWRSWVYQAGASLWTERKTSFTSIQHEKEWEKRNLNILAPSTTTRTAGWLSRTIFHVPRWVHRLRVFFGSTGAPFFSRLFSSLLNTALFILHAPTSTLFQLHSDSDALLHSAANGAWNLNGNLKLILSKESNMWNRLIGEIIGVSRVCMSIQDGVSENKWRNPKDFKQKAPRMAHANGAKWGRW